MQSCQWRGLSTDIYYSRRLIMTLHVSFETTSLNFRSHWMKQKKEIILSGDVKKTWMIKRGRGGGGKWHSERERKKE